MPKRVNKPSDSVLRKMILEDRMKLSDIGKIFGVRHSTVSNWKKALEIPGGIPIPFTREDLISWTRQGKTQKEIATLTGVTQTTVGRHMSDWGLEVLPGDFRHEILSPVVLTDLQRSLIRGTLLGDAHIRPHKDKGSAKNSLWIVEHSDAQRGYLKHLCDTLYPFIMREPYRYWRSDDRFKDGGTWSNACYTRAHRFWSGQRDIWYPQGKKIVPLSEMQDFSVDTLAYWYADDGSRCGMSCNLYTLDFSPADVELLHQTLNSQFSLATQIKRYNHTHQLYLHLTRDATQHLMSLITLRLSTIPDLHRKLIPVTRAL